MSREEDSYEKGEEAFYHEDGEINRVRVLENSCDKKWIKYDLEVIEVIRENPSYAPAKIGEKFDLKKLRNFACGGLGHLMDH